MHVVIVGDVLHSRVVRSNMWLLSTLGARVTLVAPPTLVPVGVQHWPVEVRFDLDEALAEGPDAVMMLRVQRERMHAARPTAALLPGVSLPALASRSRGCAGYPSSLLAMASGLRRGSGETPWPLAQPFGLWGMESRCPPLPPPSRAEEKQLPCSASCRWWM